MLLIVVTGELQVGVVPTMDGITLKYIERFNQDLNTMPIQAGACFGQS